jgi:hypothetical protein
MDAAIAAINDTISYKHRNGRLTAGAIVVLHPFSKSLGFNSHLHVLVTEGEFDKRGRFVHQKIIPFKAMRKTWQYQVLTQFKAALPKNRVFSMLIDHLFKKYLEGFYVHLSKESRITNKRRIARYVARYIRHPAVANTRLHRYDEKTVTFWYKDREGERLFVTMEVQVFIKALIQHIPDRNFEMIRYYGAYSRKTKRRYSGYLQRSLRQATFEDFVTKVNIDLHPKGAFSLLETVALLIPIVSFISISVLPLLTKSKTWARISSLAVFRPFFTKTLRYSTSFSVSFILTIEHSWFYMLISSSKN